MINDNDITTRKCPIARCNGRLIIRTNRNTGQKFIGYENYPKCRYTEPIEKEDDSMRVTDAASVWEMIV